MTRDQLIHEMRVTAASWKALLIFYAVIVSAMAGSAYAIL